MKPWAAPASRCHPGAALQMWGLGPVQGAQRGRWGAGPGWARAEGASRGKVLAHLVLLVSGVRM